MGNFFGAAIESDAIVDLLLRIASLNIRAFLLLLCCLIILKFLKVSAANRHVFISVAMLATLLLPFASSIAPSVDVVFEMPSSFVKSGERINTQHINSAPIASESFNYIQRFNLSAWLKNNIQILLSILLTSYLLVGLSIFLKVLLSNLRIGLTTICADVSYNDNWRSIINFHRTRFWMTTDVELRYSRLIHSPMTWGIINPVILIPNSALTWDKELIRSTVLHELAHIKRNDWLTQQLAWCVCAIYWINPMSWKALDYLHCNAETAADDMALTAGVKKSHYAENLLSVAENIYQFKQSNYAALSITGKSSELSNRIIAILNPQGIHTPVSGKPFLLSLALILFFLLPLSSIQANYRQKINLQNVPSEQEAINNISFNTRALPPIYVAPESRKDNSNNIVERPILEAAKFDMLNTDTIIETLNPKQRYSLSEQDSFSVLGKPEVIIEISSADALKIASAKLISSLQGVNEVNRDKKTDDTRSLSGQTEEPKSQNIMSPAGSQTLFAINNETQHAWNTFAQHSQIQTSTFEAVSANNQPKARITNASLAPKNIVTPSYPAKARHRGIEGQVLVQFNVDETGRVKQATVVSASPRGIFDRNVIRALEKSEFQPKMIDGKAVSVEGIQEIYRFVLES